MIGSIGTYFPAQTGNGTAALKTALAVQRASSDASASAADSQDSDEPTISTLARQLAASAVRAEERDRTLSRAQLADHAKAFSKELTTDWSPTVRAKLDAEIPKTSDPELLARAKQATEFLAGMRHEGNGRNNPFAGLSREQLANITYDDSGAYTFNERTAAFAETQKQEYEWAVKVVAKSTNEYNSTGKLTNFFRAGLEHYKVLPLIEQAQYPEDYASDLESKIKLDFNYRTHRAEGAGNDNEPMSLFKMLFDQTLKQPKALSQEKTTPTH